MINKFIEQFGNVKDYAPDLAIDVAFEIFSTFDFNASIEKNAQQFAKVINEQFAEHLPFNDNMKAHILDMCYHDANENFYELEDAGDIDNRYSVQDDFLEAVRVALIR